MIPSGRCQLPSEPQHASRVIDSLLINSEILEDCRWKV